jgi:hypothetical protein
MVALLHLRVMAALVETLLHASAQNFHHADSHAP